MRRIPPSPKAWLFILYKRTVGKAVVKAMCSGLEYISKKCGYYCFAPHTGRQRMRVHSLEQYIAWSRVIMFLEERGVKR